MGAYGVDRSWSDGMISQIKKLVGPHLLESAPLDVDREQATDLMVLRARDMRIAARVRRSGYADKYCNQFTIRSRRDNGVETELSKIINGWGDWFFYGHADGLGVIWMWMIIDLNVFRGSLIRNVKIEFGDKANGDGTFFRWFNVRSFPPSIMIASSQHFRGKL